MARSNARIARGNSKVEEVGRDPARSELRAAGYKLGGLS
jgi:hypothetical protein